MADLTPRTYWACLSSENFSTQVKDYTVRYGRDHKFSHLVQLGWSCTCRAYQYRPGHCKHIKQVINDKMLCGWSEQEDGGTADRNENNEPICPKCGGPVKAELHNV